MPLDLLSVLGYLRYLLQAYLWCDKASLLAKSSLILCQAWEGEGRVDRWPSSVSGHSATGPLEVARARVGPLLPYR